MQRVRWTLCPVNGRATDGTPRSFERSRTARAKKGSGRYPSEAGIAKRGGRSAGGEPWFESQSIVWERPKASRSNTCKPPKLKLTVLGHDLRSLYSQASVRWARTARKLRKRGSPSPTRGRWPRSRIAERFSKTDRLEPQAFGPNPACFLRKSLGHSGPAPQKCKLVGPVGLEPTTKGL